MSEHEPQTPAEGRKTSPETPVPEPAPESPRAGVPWGLAGFLVLAVLLVVFAVQNTQSVELRFLGFDGSYPLVVIVITVVVVSVLLDEILGFVMRRRRMRRAREREELKRLRNRH